MSEQTRKVKQDGSTSEKVFEGVLFDVATIIGVGDCSGEEFKSGWVCELGLELTLQSEGGRERKIFVFGRYKRGADGAIEDLQYRTPVKLLMHEIYGDDFEVTMDWKLLNEQVQGLKGHKLGMLVYCAGTYFKPENPNKELLSWQIWDQFKKISTDNTPEERAEAKNTLAIAFQESVAKGYPKKYVEEGLAAYQKFQRERDKEQSTFKPDDYEKAEREESKSDTGEAPENPPVDDDDDMPW